MTAPPADEPTSLAERRAASGIMPDFVRPMRATRGAEAFDSSDHIFELLWGGVRAMAYVRDGHARLRGANGAELNAVFPELATIAERLDARDAIVEGEIVAIDGEGYPSFDALRPRLHALAGTEDGPPAELAKPKRVAGQICFQAFDLLWLDGRWIVDRPLWQRKNRLHTVLRPSTEFAAVDFVDDEGVAFFEAVVTRRLEGVVAKEKASVYTPGRKSTAWREIRALQSGDFVIGGYTIGGGFRRGAPFGQLLLGAYEEGRFEYVGAVSGGLSDTEAKTVLRLLEPHLADTSPFHDAPRIPRLIHWTQPSLVCHVRFSEWSLDGYLRFPIFSALRPDVEAQDCSLD